MSDTDINFRYVRKWRFDELDIELVMEQAFCDRETALIAIIRSRGDLITAILSLT